MVPPVNAGWLHGDADTLGEIRLEINQQASKSPSRSRLKAVSEATGVKG
jgi:hypothetical protein